MKIKGLDGKTHSWYLVGYCPDKDSERLRSELHIQARALLYEVYPSYKILEEVPLPGSGGLFADFYLPQKKLMVEAQGRQHYEFVQHFHVNQMGYWESKKRDENKKTWCATNGITLIELPYKENQDEWRARINSTAEIG